MNGYPEKKHGAVLRQHLTLPGLKVADIGCGDGALVRSLARDGAEATGVEIDERALGRALAKAKEGAGGTYLCARGEALPFAAGALDAVIFFNSLHHVPLEDQEAALAEAGRALKPGGLLYVVEPLAEGPGHALMVPVEDETAVRAAAYAALQAAGAGPAFEPIEESRYNAPYKVASFAAWKEDMVAVDPARRPAVEAQGPEWEEAFEAAAERCEEGFRLPNPSRLNILRRV